MKRGSSTLKLREGSSPTPAYVRMTKRAIALFPAIRRPSRHGLLSRDPSCRQSRPSLLDRRLPPIIIPTQLLRLPPQLNRVVCELTQFQAPLMMQSHAVLPVIRRS